MAKRSRFVLIVAVLALAAAAGYGLYVARLFIEGGGYVSSQPFDAEAWKAEPSPEKWRSPRRLRMVDDLLGRGLLIGKSRSAVIRLLGEPDESRTSAWDMWYYLGPERGFLRIDSEWLVLRCDGAGQVEEATIYRD